MNRTTSIAKLDKVLKWDIVIIGGGTSQIQKNIIAERGLGMPKEPKVEGA